MENIDFYIAYDPIREHSIHFSSSGNVYPQQDGTDLNFLLDAIEGFKKMYKFIFGTDFERK